MLSRRPTVRVSACAVTTLLVLGSCAAAATPSPPLSPAPAASTTAAPDPATPGPSAAAATSAQDTRAPSPDPSPTPIPSPTGTPAPVSWGDAVLVRGVESCVASGVTVATPDPSGRIHVVGGDITCTMEMNDPRVSGVKSGPFEIDAWGTETDGAFVQWGSPRKIVNDGGTWVGTFTGIRTPQTGDLLSIWFEGTGAYAGLSFFEWVEVPPDAGGYTPYPVTGLIFPGKPPMPSPVAP